MLRKQNVNNDVTKDSPINSTLTNTHQIKIWAKSTTRTPDDIFTKNLQFVQKNDTCQEF